jgi:glycosyltransferase involved in cell wall biosynthesis
LLCPEMTLFVNRQLFPKGPITFLQRMSVKNIAPQYPDVTKSKPLIIHSPSARICKGTSHIINAIEELKLKYDFDFKLIENMTRSEALKLISTCDIFVDQLITGSYGSACMEAMSFGKPVLTIILPEVFEAGLPLECPIVNSNPENIKQQLEKLIIDPLYRNQIGKASRTFVEKYHDADKLALDLLNIYKKELEVKTS